MKHKQLWTALFASAAMLALILDGQTAIEGGRIGIELCLKTVVPSLFPFFVFSSILTQSVTGQNFPLLAPLGHLCGVPKGMESILLVGFLGGYPVGAQAVHTAFQDGKLSKTQAERLLSFCSNAGPAFLFGMVASLFPRQAMVWSLWLIHLISAILVSLIIPRESSSMQIFQTSSKTSVTKVFQMSIRVMATVCGWVILFRVLIAFLKRWFLWLLPVEIQVLLIGVLELSNGCMELFSVPDVQIRFLICSIVLSLGGLCVTMQTVSVTRGLSLRLYLLGKLLQTCFGIAISVGILYHRWRAFFLVLLLFYLPHRMRKKQ